MIGCGGLPADAAGKIQHPGAGVARARAPANDPPIILADEPTAPLDSHRAMSVMKLLHDLAERQGTAVIVVTHDENIIPVFKRLYRLRDGVLHEEPGEDRPIQVDEVALI